MPNLVFCFYSDTNGNLRHTEEQPDDVTIEEGWWYWKKGTAYEACFEIGRSVRVPTDYGDTHDLWGVAFVYEKENPEHLQGLYRLLTELAENSLAP